MTEHRIASLLPSTTEIVCALGAGEQLVARSHECDFPPGVERLPAATSARLADGTSREIDDRVKDLVGRGLSIYDVDAELLRELAPTVVLTQDQCEVCAASVSDVEQALASWIGEAPRLVSLSPSTLGDVFGDVAHVGQALGLEARASACVTAWTERITSIGERSGALPRPRVACIEWIDPPMTAGNWVPELVALAGGEALLATAGAHSTWLDWEALREADPDVIIAMPCGFDLARTRLELSALEQRPGWSALRAVREGRVHLTDANAYFNRPGPRLVESTEILAEILHPDVFEFGHRGRGHAAA
jgi:iron complex transport system substrate-binding protein